MTNVIYRPALLLHKGLATGMYTSFIGIYVRPGQFGRVEKALSPMAEVIELYEMSGPFDLLIKVNAGSRQAIEVMAGNILQLEGVEKTFNMLSIGEKRAENAPDRPWQPSSASASMREKSATSSSHCFQSAIYWRRMR